MIARGLILAGCLAPGALLVAAPVDAQRRDRLVKELTNPYSSLSVRRDKRAAENRQRVERRRQQNRLATERRQRYTPRWDDPMDADDGED